jgi:DNA-binding ferritin-like protein
MEPDIKLTNLYVASLRAIYLIEQFAHWGTRGVSFYSDHLMFERLYQQAAKDADLAAEKFIGLFGEDAVDFKAQQEYLNKLLIKYEDHAMEKLRLALTIEKDFVGFSKQVYDTFDKDGTLSLGLDDMFCQIASNHEGSIYLLQQALDEENND